VRISSMAKPILPPFTTIEVGVDMNESWNHISARGMKNLLTILDDENDNMNGLIEYISSHPDTKKRIKNVSQFNFTFPENEKLAELFDEIIAEIQH